LVAVPDGTVAWRICRKTSGRPKEILGPDSKQPMRFRLTTTVEEVAEAYGPDTYRVYALDDVGKVLDFVTELDLSDDRRDRRNAGLETSHGSRTSVFAASTDLRYALDAIVQMMRANGEALRSVAVAQADWVKSIASSRGFFRNGPPPMLPSKREDDDEEDEQDDDDDDPVEPQKKTIYDVLAPFAEQIAPSVGPLVTMLTSGAKNAPAVQSGSTPTARVDGPHTDLASRPNWEVRDFIDFRYSSEKAKAKKAAQAAQASSDQPNATTAKRSLQERVRADPKLLAHFMAISALLSDGERVGLMGFANQFGDLEQERLLAEIRARPAAEAATLLRALLVELNPSQSEASSTSDE
jgi:hypothetical protein